MKNDLVVKDNILINASYNLEVTEQRLILLSIIRARETGQGITSDSKLEIHASDYASRFDVTKEAAYNALNVVPLITRLEKHFTSYQLKQVAQLTSKYAIRLYELLIAWREIGKTPQISLTEFREKLGLEVSEYQKMVNFKSRVLEPAIQQINYYTDINVKYEQYKTGRSITGLSFSFKQKKVDESEVRKEPTLTEEFSKISDAQRYLFATKLSELPEMGEYSQGTESYSQFAIRIAEMLKNLEKFTELYPLLKKVGFKS